MPLSRARRSIQDPRAGARKARAGERAMRALYAFDGEVIAAPAKAYIEARAVAAAPFSLWRYGAPLRCEMPHMLLIAR